MRVAVLAVRQESNSFAPGTTSLDAFNERGLQFGENVLSAADPVLSGFIAAADHAIDIVPVVRAAAVAGPPIDTATLDTLVGYVRDGLLGVGQVDAVFASLHGACVSPAGDSVDERIATEIRAIVGPDTPLVAALDHHGWITRGFLNQVDSVVAHRTQPHDLVDTGACAARLLERQLRSGTRPHLSLRRIPMVVHQEQFSTSSGPMAQWFAHARQLETRDGIWSVSTFPMQPWLDVPDAGWSVVVVGDPAHAAQIEAAADELAEDVWARRADFDVQISLSIEAGIVAAIDHAASGRGLAVLADLGDSVFGGAHGDSTVVLDALLRERLPGPALISVTDPIVAAQCFAAGVGAAVEVALGGALSGTEPLPVRATVTAVASGRLALPGFIHESTDQGRSALLKCGDTVFVAVTERRGVGSNHPAVFERLGVDVGQCAIVCLKSAMNVQGYAEFTPTLFMVDTPGSTQGDLAGLPWRHRPKPLFPFEPVTSWRT